MDTNPPSPACPDCGAPLPPESPFALCAACLLRQALASQTRIDDEKPTPFFPPLTPEEITDRFPGFEILECLGRGGMGVVYKARQKSLDRWVAIKIVAPEKHGEERLAGRFAREAATLAKLGHPNIVTIHDFGETDGLFYIVMEYVDGVNLRDLVSDGRLAPEQALAIVPPICDALQYAHEKGVVHRDIKPENILLDRDGRVRIADFGIAALLGGPGEPAGTPPYAAPEQTVPTATADHRADIHALGVVFYEMLTGERPSGQVIAPSKRDDTETRLVGMVLRAMAKNPDHRFQTAGDFRTALDSVGTAPHAAGNGESTRKWILPAVALLVLGIIGYFFWPQPTLPEKPGKPAVDRAETTPQKMDKPLIDGSNISLDDMKALIDYSINPEQAAILLERGRREIKGMSGRSRLATIVISILCNQGYGDEAWNLISPDTGKIREGQVAAWFNSSKESLDAKLKRIERLTNPNDRESAMACLFQGGISIDEICAFDFNKIIPKSNEERNRIFLSLYGKLTSQPTFGKIPDERIKLLRKCLDLTAEGWLDPIEAVRIFRATEDRESFNQWDMLADMKWNLPKGSYERIREVIIQNMATEDPERAIRMLVENIPLKQRYLLLSLTYDKMREDTPDTCAERVRALLPEFDASTAEQLSECVIRGALRAGDLDLAKEWMPRTSNHRLRMELADRYASVLEQRKKELEKRPNDPDASPPLPSGSIGVGGLIYRLPERDPGTPSKTADGHSPEPVKILPPSGDR